MGRYPKQVTVGNADPDLWGQGVVVVNLLAVIPEHEVQQVLNQIGAIL
jgi:hypothetical protein